MTTIKLKRSSSTGVTPSTSDLELGELAVNTFDGKLFLKKNDGSDSIVEFNPTSATGSNIVVNDSSGTSSSALLVDYNVSGDTPELTGDILKRGLFIDVDSSANMGTTDNEHRLYGGYIDVRNTGDSDIVNGLRVFQQNNHTAGTTTISRGVASELTNQASGTGTVTDIYGFYGVTNQSSVNAVNEIAGLKLQTNAISTGTGGGTTLAGADIEVQRNGGAYTNAYGIKVLLDDNNNNSDAPAVTNSYLIHASYEGPTMATNDWGLYLPDTGATNFFGGPVELDGVVDITNTTAPSAIDTNAALKVAGGMTVQSWTFFNIAGSNVVYDADSSARQVFDIRRNNLNQWYLTLDADGDLTFDANNTNNATGVVNFSAPVKFLEQIQGEVNINVAGTNLLLDSDSSTRQTIDWRQNDVNYWYLNLTADGNLEFEPNPTNNTTPRFDIESRAYLIETVDVVNSSSLTENMGLTVNTDLSGNTALTADRIGYGIYVDLDSDFDNSNSNGNDLWVTGIRSDTRVSTPHEYVRGMRSFTQVNHSSGNVFDLTACRSQAVFNGSGTADVTQIYGALNEATHNSSIDITGDMYGMRNTVTLFTSSGGANDLYGTFSETQFSGNTVNDIYGVYSLIDNNGTGGNATGNAYGLYVRYEGGLPATGANKNYGLYINDNIGMENFVGGDLTTFSDDIRVEGDTIQNCAGGQFVFDSDTATRTIMRFDQNDLRQWFWTIDNLGGLAFENDSTNNPNGEIQFYSKVKNRSTFTNTGDILGLTANKFEVIKHSQTNLVYTANTVTGSDGAFFDFEAGETIDIRGSTNNNGQYTIQSIGDSGGDTNNVLTITANSFTAETDTASGFITQEKLGISYDNDAVALSLYINTAGDETSINQFPDSYGFNAHFSSGSFSSFAHRRDFTLHKSESANATKGGLWVQEYNSSTGDQLGFDRIFTDSYGGIAEVTANGNTTTNDITVGSLTSTNHGSIDGVEIGLAGGTTSVTNVAIGYPSGVGRPLEQFTSANNIAIGYEASENNVNGYECVAIGRGALQDNISGQRNTALGHQALRDNGTGGGNSFGNTAIGWQASLNNTTGNNNVSLGYAALTAATTASNNTAIGFRALDTAGIGNDNTAVGYNCLTTLSSGAQNVVVGSGAGTTLTGGSNNTVLGYNAEPSSATASNEITLGDGNVTSFRVPGLDFEINTNGRVGISTDTPTAPLHVNDNDGIRVGTTNFDLRFKANYAPAVAVGGSTAAGIITTSGTSSGAAHVGVEIPANDSNDGFYVITDSDLDGTPDTVALKINAAGSLGIGTTTFNDSYKTTIEGSDQETANLTDTGTHGATLFLRATGEDVGSGGAVAFGTTNGNKRPFAAIKGLVVDGTTNSVGDLAFSTRDTTSATALTERMRLKQNGRLGLGTNDPQEALHVSGNIRVNNSQEFRTTDTGGSARTIMRVNNSNELEYGWSGAGPVKFMGGGSYTERMRIDTSGNVIVPGGVTLGTSVGVYSAANTLEDYEEGTWTPSYFMSTTDFTSITMDTLSATYTKIGDIVMIQGWIRTDAVDATGAAGQLRISGLPFAISGYGAISIGRSEGWTNNIWHCQLVGGETDIRLYKRTSLSGQDNIMTDADMITGTSANRNNLVFAGQYRTTA